MQIGMAQQRVKIYRAKLRDEVHQKYQLDLKKMIEQGWQTISWCEAGRDFLGRVILRVKYQR